ncbi:FxsB family radical SAM/SPASM domain protein [Actinoplanes sp. NEAU-A12]|uniref:FxsB family radical SAM/SPASM domain protein n=1 Tax=Actinoplanes sandaracinus TaxID=3045177 RepID=A0ABT6WGM2_9ACTN|nr:FxsB family cyclophane-forming radical SAM/SPASM peptide maturase [Actinoplanes sandaracinus]MDI6098869.1 FxsB family radical SAM/SPASM domain protein [Actinoplanes sandaracinus]
MTGDPPWPHRLLHVEHLRAAGWRPTPLREFILKVHQRCNLACDYCYVYELADQSWRDRPRVMAPQTWRAAFARIADHVRLHRLGDVSIVLHGGEPLLAGPRMLSALIRDLRSELDGLCRVQIGMQTNGLLLDGPVLDLLHAEHVRIGVSLDGSAADHDRRRRRRDGTGSASGVHAALTRLGSAAYRSSYAGVLCTVDPRTDPVATYEALLAYAPPAIDLLLPHANWSVPPTGPVAGYGDWLIAMFDRWYDAEHCETSVRLFEEAMSLVLGGASRSEQLGTSPAAFAVIESDGAIEQVDALKSAYPGACATGRHVDTDSFDDVLTHPGIVARQIGVSALSEICRKCPVNNVCGGGHYAHRYRAGSGFRNPSVYCVALQRFIGHVRRRVASGLAVTRAGGE